MKVVSRPPFPFFEWGDRGGYVAWGGTKACIRPVALAALGQRYRRYRLADPDAEEAMAGSLRRWGSCRRWWRAVREAQLELLDGFKR